MSKRRRSPSFIRRALPELDAIRARVKAKRSIPADDRSGPSIGDSAPPGPASDNPLDAPATPPLAIPAHDRTILCWDLDHFYSPVPANRQLLVEPERSRIWPATARPMPGIAWREVEQRSFLEDTVAQLAPFVFAEAEPDDPTEYWTGNDMFDGVDAFMLAGILRVAHPRRVVEVGSGWSTLVTARVNREAFGGEIDVTCVEPYPPAFMLGGLDGVSRLIQSRVELCEWTLFEALGPGDILFIDSSHVTKTGSDVNYLFQEVVPRLPVGAYVHVHDIFLPRDYPEDWIQAGRAWNEQYLVRAFLTCNDDFEVVASSAWLWEHARASFTAIESFPAATARGGGSLWLRRVCDGGANRR